MVIVWRHRFEVSLSLDEAHRILHEYPNCDMDAAQSEKDRPKPPGPQSLPLMARVHSVGDVA